ncbi:hypothetical protein [Nitrosopumilus sp.]|uniref:hypothetical protein n=1 Tax=Nitrosopumilus sp. TaxID=2024843 RepID=UPI0034A05F7E
MQTDLSKICSNLITRIIFIIMTGKLGIIEIPTPEINQQMIMVEQLNLLDGIYEKLLKDYENCNLVYQTVMNNFFAGK